MGKNTFAYGFGLLQVIFAILFGIFVRYNDDAVSLAAKANYSHYTEWTSVACMIWIGFGFLMTFLAKNGFTALGHTMMISVVAVEWWLLIGNFWAQALSDSHAGIGKETQGTGRWSKITLDVPQMIQGLFAAAAVLISFGAVIGRVSMGQLVFLTLVEVFFYALNGALYSEYIKASDVGGSVILHAFGAYYGLAAALALNRGQAKAKDQSNNTSNATSDIFSLVGTIFLFIYWPSFTAALVPINSADQNRTFVNTILAIGASVIATYVVSPIVIGDERTGHVNVVQLQNATLAGGVAIGTACTFKVQPLGAILIGSVAGIVSTIGYQYLQPKLQNSIGLIDSCGVHNLHGMPGIIGGVSAAIAVAVGAADGSLESANFSSRDGTARSNGAQAAIQFAGLLVTLVFAVVTGGLAGFIASKFDTLSEFYHDAAEYNTSYYPVNQDSHQAEHGASPAGPSSASENMHSKNNNNYGTLNGDASAVPLITQANLH